MAERPAADPASLGWRAACLGVCAAVLAGNAWHIIVNRAAPTFDDAWYLETSFRIFMACKRGLWPGLQACTEAFRIKAPLIAMLPLPLYALFGTGERIALWINEAALALTFYCVYRIGRLLYGERAGLAAAAAAALMPLLYGLGRVYLVESTLTALVAASAWAILEARPAGGAGAWRRGILLGCGLLAKSIYPLYLLGPVWLLRRELSPTAKRSLTVGMALAATWYAFNWPYVLGFGFSAGFGRIALDYGGTTAGWILSMGQDVLSWPYLAGAALLAMLAWRARGAPTGSPAERFLAAWSLPPAAVFLLGVNKEVRYLAPLLPAAAVALGAMAAAWACDRRRAVLLAGLLAGPLLVFSSQTFGLPAAPPLGSNGPPLAVPEWDRQAALSAVVRHAREDSVIAVGLEHPAFNANNLSCLAASRGFGLRFVNLGYAQSSAESAVIRLKDKGAGFLIMVDGLRSDELPDFLNRANAGIAGKLASGTLPADLLEQVPLREGVTAVLFRLRNGTPND